MKNLATYILAGALSFGALSCTDFLDNPRQGVQNLDNFYNNETEITQGLMSSYYWLSGDDWWYKDFFRFVGDICSDDAFDGYTDQLDFTLLSKFDITPQNEWLGQEWIYSYKGIFHANIVIEKTTNSPYDDENFKNQAIAEAKVLRAYQYFGLVRNFGGVILLDKPALTGEISDEQALLGRSTEAESWAFIEQDLVEAIDHLPTRGAQDGRELGRITKGTAQALLAKAYLYQGKYQEALTQANAVIGSGDYSLVPDLELLWDNSVRNSTESIFEIQSSGDVTFRLGTSFPTVSGSRSNKNDPEFFGGVVNGWGFNSPSSHLDNAFENGDKRRGMTIIKHLDKIDKDGNPDSDGFAYHTFAGDENDGSNASGRMNRKMFLKPSVRGDWHGINPYQYKIIRYADVLLMAAECEVRVGSAATATHYVNQLRERAFGDNSHNIATVTLDDVLHERRLELAMEGERFYDLKRTGRMTQAMNDFVNYNLNNNSDYDAGNDKGSLWDESKHMYFPIPQTQIDLSNGIVKQNPGY
ncbi:RagB/SusD family nutrient uptake outer membrane protein [Flammeovirga sp. EKP202]|uniref:RagB/SusD family nutrient uptake outer membrane protein n=1 Tax=Flammeovirga sp. EKP202 TaxID=2770592 RepID=UPI00165FC654|nr:RagB/SusD family nutrient uptake outer membrane protein [Flammeovirga sp. EKP202]MBD0404679.1 RagB/SusD family nutrient uptake outer membrane protein [Flammeovirga sp. EKP202]